MYSGPTGPSSSVRRAEDERKMESIEDVRGNGKHRMKIQSSELQYNYSVRLMYTLYRKSACKNG
jgi:hypothetical protein